MHPSLQVCMLTTPRDPNRSLQRMPEAPMVRGREAQETAQICCRLLAALLHVCCCALGVCRAWRADAP
eukprot:9455410-Alexandrium_andersonii.AAC.1